MKTAFEIARDQDGQTLEQARAAMGRTAEQSIERPLEDASPNFDQLSPIEQSSDIEPFFEDVMPFAEPSSESDSLPVQSALISANTGARFGAMRALQQLVTTLEVVAEQKQTVDTMMTLLLLETRAARRRHRINWLKAIVGVMLVLWLVVVTRGGILTNFWWAFPGTAWAVDKTAHRRRETASALGQAGDPRAVGVLAVVVRDGDRSVRRAANFALLTLLPRVRADHAAFITSDQMNALLELGFHSPPGMQIAVLKALEQVGDQRAIPVVENLVLSSQPDVREQASQCLPFLLARVRRSEQSATLLRGAANPGREASGHELLRAAATASENTPADQLMRPTVNKL